MKQKLIDETIKAVKRQRYLDGIAYQLEMTKAGAIKRLNKAIALGFIRRIERGVYEVKENER